jgi:hypothetical protein
MLKETQYNALIEQKKKTFFEKRKNRQQLVE